MAMEGDAIEFEFINDLPQESIIHWPACAIRAGRQSTKCRDTWWASPLPVQVASRQRAQVKVI